MIPNSTDAIERTILSSKLEGDLSQRLEQIPSDERGWLNTLLGRLVKVTPVQAFIDGVWKNVALVGYAGLSELGPNIRVLWSLTFPKPFAGVINLADNEEVAVASIKGNEYIFSKAGTYLGRVQSAQKHQHPQSL